MEWNGMEFKGMEWNGMKNERTKHKLSIFSRRGTENGLQMKVKSRLNSTLC